MSLPLPAVLAHLDSLAPLHHAASWDNVGLLVDPRQRQQCGGAKQDYEVEQVLLTIDATPEVFAELAGLSNALLVAYHPPLFRPVKRVSSEDSELLLLAVQSGVPIYSPHTALDCVPGGLNDWLAEGIGKGAVSAVVPQRLAAEDSQPSRLAGEGRRIELSEPVPLQVLVDRIKVHLGVNSLRLASSLRHRRVNEVPGEGELIRSVVVAGGSGSSIFTHGPRADLYVTGECGHHEVLACLRRGSSLLLTEHSTSERGYLAVYRERLLQLVGQNLSIQLAEADVEPLVVV